MRFFGDWRKSASTTGTISTQTVDSVPGFLQHAGAAWPLQSRSDPAYVNTRLKLDPAAASLRVDCREP